MSHSISSVVAFCTILPLTVVVICLPRKSQSVTTPGPTGQSVSDPLTRNIDPASVSRKSCRP